MNDAITNETCNVSVIDRVRMGFFREFKGRNVVLLSGSRLAMAKLASSLRRLEERGAEPNALHSLPFVEALENVRLTAYPAGAEEYLRREDGDQTTFHWRLKPEGWLEAAEKIEVVGATSGAGHAYLSTLGGADDVCVMVSVGEYSDEWWRTHREGPDR